MFDYSNNIDSASKVWLHQDDLKKINRGIFARDAYVKSWGCHTGESMSKKWHEATGVDDDRRDGQDAIHDRRTAGALQPDRSLGAVRRSGPAGHAASRRVIVPSTRRALHALSPPPGE